MNYKSLNLYYVSLLGAINGAIYSVTALFLEREFTRVLIESNIRKSEELGMTPVQAAQNTLNEPIVVGLFIALFTLASYLTYRYLTKSIKSAFVFWLLAGLMAVTAWNVIILSLTWVEMHLTGQTLSYNRVISSRYTIFGPTSIALVLVVNLIYATALQLLFAARSHNNNRAI